MSFSLGGNISCLLTGLMKNNLLSKNNVGGGLVDIFLPYLTLVMWILGVDNINCQ